MRSGLGNGSFVLLAALVGDAIVSRRFLSYCKTHKSIKAVSRLQLMKDC